MDTPILIIGLGNPGDQYAKTRHNVGFMVVDALLRSITPSGTTWSRDQKQRALTFQGKIEDQSVILALPQTYMNNAGQAAGQLAQYYRIPSERIWVVQDDIDVPIGKLKIRVGGGSGGHRGIESISERLDTDQFVRFRIGIGHPRMLIDEHEDPTVKVDDYVLSVFAKNERHVVRQEIKRAVRALRDALANGLDTAMNRYNQ